MKEAGESSAFQTNDSQRKAVLFALSRSIVLIRIRGLPGTCKTRVASLLISTALKMKLKRKDDAPCTSNNDDDDTIRTTTIRTSKSIGRDTFQRSAADVLLQALLGMSVPAVRHGRPASVSPSVQAIG